MVHRNVKITDSLSSVILCPSFALPFSSITTTSILLGYYIEKVSYESTSLDVSFVYPALWVNILSYTAFLSIIVFCSSYRIIAAVVDGRCSAISIARLESLPFPLSWICGSEGERSLMKFVVLTLFFPGLGVLFGLHILSYFCGSSFLMWNLPLDLFLASNSLWRLLISASVYVLNYFSALNPTQPCINDWLQED